MKTEIQMPNMRKITCTYFKRKTPKYQKMNLPEKKSKKTEYNSKSLTIFFNVKTCQITEDTKKCKLKWNIEFLSWWTEKDLTERTPSFGKGLGKWTRVYLAIRNPNWYISQGHMANVYTMKSACPKKITGEVCKKYVNKNVRYITEHKNKIGIGLGFLWSIHAMP